MLYSLIGDVEGATKKMARAAAALHMLGHHDDAKVMPVLRTMPPSVPWSLSRSCGTAASPTMSHTAT